MSEAHAMLAYAMPVMSDMMNATAPMTGGSIAPPLEAVASMAPARAAGMPIFFMMGMVSGPVVATSAVGLPDTEPYSPLAVTQAFAAPPRMRPVTAPASSKNSCPPPDFS